MRVKLSQISALINTTLVSFPEGARCRSAAAIMLAYKYFKRVTTISDTWKSAAPSKPKNYNPKIDARQYEVTKPKKEKAHKKPQK